MTDIVKMNFDEAIVAHAEWKLKLTLYLQGDGNLDHSIVCQDNQCKLGKWIYSDGKKYANEHTYEHLRKVHADFHRCAGMVIQTVDSKKIDEAKNLIAPESEYTKISAIVVEAISAVKKRVEEKTNMIMQNVNVGVLVIDRNLTVQSGYSQHCHELFDTEQVAGINICDLLNLAPKDRRHFGATFEQVFDDILPAECSLSMLPTRVHRGMKVLELHTNVVRSDGKEIDFVLFTVSDATKMVALEAENAENAALLKIIRNRESFVNFVKDAKVALDALLTGDERNQVLLRREVHTVKGNCSMFDMLQLMQEIGQIEDHETLTFADVRAIRESLTVFVDKYKDFIGVSFSEVSEEIHTIPESELVEIETKLKGIDDVRRAQDFIGEITAKLRMRSARSVIGPVEERVQALAQRMHKSVACKVVGESTLVNPKRLGPVVQVLSHILRNSVDHGLETSEERQEAGKVEQGTITISFVSNSLGTLKIVVEDDGRGISTARLVEKAVKVGSISKERALKMNESEMINLIFLDGVSTANEVTDVSGRGVGMSALLATVNSIGGTLEVKTALGKGTSIYISIPDTVESNRIVRAA